VSSAQFSADDPDATKICPLCGETIKAVAVKCRFCGEVLDASRMSAARVGAGGDGPWRDGDRIVCRTGGELPSRCVKSNEPVERLTTKNFVYVPWWVLIVLLGAGPCIWIIVSLAVQKKVDLTFGLGSAARNTARTHAAVAWTAALAGLGMIGYFVGMSVVAVARNQPSGWWGLAGFAVFLIGAVYGSVMMPVLKVRKVEGRLAWFSGACPAFLDELPQYDGQTA
jgi:hypothetical protein